MTDHDERQADAGLTNDKPGTDDTPIEAIARGLIVSFG